MNLESVGKKIDDIDVTISSRIIELFSAGLYSSPNKAFEELICNSYDAFASKVAVYSPDDPTVSNAYIWVCDNGEGLDVLLNNLPQEEIERIKEIAEDCISWIDDILLDKEETYKMQGYKLGRSISNLYFRDKYMQKKNNLFSAENANEGALHLLFYLTLFISKRTPDFFGIDNIETGRNPRLCGYLMKNLASLVEENDKQVLITTQNPAVLDGMNLHDDNQRLFVVTRKDNGATKIERIKLKPMRDGKDVQNKLSDLWMKGFLGGIPDNF